MPSATFLITFMVMALFYVLCEAAPQMASLAHTMPDLFNSTDTGVSMAAMEDDPDDIFHVPNLNGDIWENKQRCYYWDYSEKWQDVGGKHSQFVHDAVDQMCQVIAAYVGSTGFMKDDTVSCNIPEQSTDSCTHADYCTQMSVCKPVDKNTQGRNYDRSIAVKVTYRGRSNTEVDRFTGFDSNYCFRLMALALDCGAGGEWIVQYGDSPLDFWEAKADPNRNTCSDNGYVTIL